MYVPDYELVIVPAGMLYYCTPMTGLAGHLDRHQVEVFRPVFSLTSYSSLSTVQQKMAFFYIHSSSCLLYCATSLTGQTSNELMRCGAMRKLLRPAAL